MLREKNNAQHTGKTFLIIIVAVMVFCSTVHAQSDTGTQSLPFAVLYHGQSVKKSAQVSSPFVPFLLPVMLVGSGNCKATLSASEPQSGEMLGAVALGACSGPYSVVDYNAGAADHSITVQVVVEEYGIVFFGGILIAPASGFPRSLTFSVSF